MTCTISDSRNVLETVESTNHHKDMLQIQNGLTKISNDLSELKHYMLATATGHHEVVGSSVSIHSNGQIGCGSLVYLNRFNAEAVKFADIESNCSRRLSVQTAKRENVKISRWPTTS